MNKDESKGTVTIAVEEYNRLKAIEEDKPFKTVYLDYGTFEIPTTKGIFNDRLIAEVANLKQQVEHMVYLSHFRNKRALVKAWRKKKL